jgi:hypothetical protein
MGKHKISRDDIRAGLKAALADRTFIRLSRACETGMVRGYVQAVGPKLFVICLVSDAARYDGFQAFRIKDVVSFSPDPHAAFSEAALFARGEVRPRAPAVVVDDMEGLVMSASLAFPLITLHYEIKDPGVCWIGAVRSVGKGVVDFLEIDPDAQWDEKPTVYPLTGITRVDFGCGYEASLALVGGPAPVVSVSAVQG